MSRFLRILSAATFLIVSQAAHAGMKELDLSKLKADLSPFLGAGCVDNDQAKGFVCPPEVMRRFGCTDLKQDDRVGGIDMPVALCTIGKGEARKMAAKGVQSVGERGCRVLIPYRYVLYTTKGFKVAKSAGEFVFLAAPFDRPEKAASLAMALNPKLSAKLPEPSDERVLKVRDKEFRVASFSEEGSSITVRLFERTICGCGTHPIFAVDYEVSPSGAIKEKGRKMVMDGKTEICVD
ncbi:MAG TPA: hypothetical protein PLY45_05565 [bacterium]|nr:hypothetical protein [bacterium]